MMMGSFLFKQKAREMLKGKWQNALVVSFFSGVFLTAAQVVQSIGLKDVQSVMNSLTMLIYSLGEELSGAQSRQLTELYSKLFEALGGISQAMWALMIGMNLLALLLTPALSLGCQYYFIRLTRNEDIGIRDGLLCRVRILLKALWLYARMYVQILLWSLLFIVPGVSAALRYSMATYYLAEDPSLSAGEALRKSKAAMGEKGRKSSYLMLLISFVGWNLLISFAQLMFLSMLGTVVTMVAVQFMSLALNTYINAACAAYYFAVSRPEGMDDLMGTMRRRMRQAGISDSDIDAAGFGRPPQDRADEDDGGDER